jgi:hypothetical protein
MAMCSDHSCSTEELLEATRSGTVIWAFSGTLSLLTALSSQYLLAGWDIEHLEEALQPLLYQVKLWASVTSLLLSLSGGLSLLLCYFAGKRGFQIKWGRVESEGLMVALFALHIPAWFILL